MVIRAEQKKAVWLWVALCRGIRQVVAWHFGSRGASTCRALWNKILASYHQAFCFNDFWEANQKVIPQYQHRACGKQ
ncbi:MAG: IS1 family transposase [Cytophagaceae bacterium]|nr:MAG: IS1 family transposase [Cytophagaceae bacterium]